MNRFRGDDGISLVEGLIVSAVLAIAVGTIGTVLVSGLRTARFGERESGGIDIGRIAQQQIQRDIRNAVAVDIQNCATADAPQEYCLELIGQKPDGSLDQIRWRATQPVANGETVLFRDADCDPGFTACNQTREIVTLANRARSVPVFVCDSSTTFPQIGVTFIVCVPPHDGRGCGSNSTTGGDTIGVLTLTTTVRPRSVTGSIC